MTALCGVAQNFLHLLLARFGVGAGEAGVAPSSHATIAAIFPPESRSTAMAVFSAGGSLGVLLAFAISGPMEVMIGWRLTFVVLGIPGMVLALIFALTVPALPTPPSAGRPASGGLLGGLKILMSPVFRNLLLSISMVNMLSFGLPQWLPAYLERSFGASRAVLGLQLAISQGGGATTNEEPRRGKAGDCQDR